jgi:hypothetical protein
LGSDDKVIAFIMDKYIQTQTWLTLSTSVHLTAIPSQETYVFCGALITITHFPTYPNFSVGLFVITMVSEEPFSLTPHPVRESPIFGTLSNCSIAYTITHVHGIHIDIDVCIQTGLRLQKEIVLKQILNE